MRERTGGREGGMTKLPALAILATALILPACGTDGTGGWSAFVEDVSNIDIGGEWNPREGRADQLRRANALRREGRQEEALALYRVLAEAGYPHGMVPLARAYLRGESVPQDAERAAELLEEAASKPSRVRGAAERDLGRLYQRGVGVPRNPEKAIELFAQAAGRGNTGAMTLLGQAKLTGEGTEQNLAEGIALLNEASGAGHTGAMVRLARFYLATESAHHDDELAKYWLERAASLGNEVASQMLASDNRI